MTHKIINTIKELFAKLRCRYAQWRLARATKRAHGEWSVEVQHRKECLIAAVMDTKQGRHALSEAMLEPFRARPVRPINENTQAVKRNV